MRVNIPPGPTMRAGGEGRLVSPRLARIPDGVVAREVDGGIVLLNADTGRYFTLDDIGARVWTLLRAEPSLEAVCLALSTEFDVEAIQLRADVQALVDTLVAHGLLETDDA
jgi:hypothetical protein